MIKALRVQGLGALAFLVLLLPFIQNCTSSFKTLTGGSDSASSNGNGNGTNPPALNTVTLSTTLTGPTSNSLIPVTVNFNENISGVSASSFSITNGSVSMLSGSGNSYALSIWALSPGPVTVTLNAGAVVDPNGNPNQASNTLSVTYQSEVGSCSLVTNPTPPTYLSSRWSQAAYNTWIALIDTALTRIGFIPSPNTQTPAITRSFPLPFVNDGSGNCAVAYAQVQLPRPQTGANAMVVAIPCLGEGQDSTANVQSALQQLMSFQSSQQASGLPSSLELDFSASCNYYFLESTVAKTPVINLPDGIQDLTISGGNSLDNAATLIFANPSLVDPVGTSNTVATFPHMSGGNPSAPFQDAIDFNSGARILFTNLKMDYRTPVIVNNVTQWQQLVPFRSYATIGSDGQGLYLLVSPDANGFTYYDLSVREILLADPLSSLDPAYSVPRVWIGNSCNFSTSLSATGALVLRDTNGKSCLTPLAGYLGGTAIIVHDDKKIPNMDLGSASAIPVAPPLGETLNDVSFVNVQIGQAPKVLFTFGLNEGLMFSNFIAKPLDGSHAGLSGGFSQGQVVSDVIIENSQFAYTGDDFINFHASIATVTSVGPYNATTNTTPIQIASNAATQLQNTSSVCFITPEFEPLVCTKLGSISPGKPPTLNVPGNITTVQVNDFVFCTDDPVRNLFISGNSFTSGGHVRVKANNAYITNNTFLHSGGVMVENINATYDEGNLERNISILNNSFDYVQADQIYGAIAVGTSTGGNGDASALVAPEQVIRHIMISGNSFFDGIAPAIMTGSMAESLVDSTNMLAPQSGSVPTPITLANLSGPDQFSTSTWWTANGPGQTLSPICAILPP